MKTVTEMAREAFACSFSDLPISEGRIKAFAALVAAQEREECWRTAENYDTGYEAAEAIRARGTT